jgi:hypothetical protein
MKAVLFIAAVLFLFAPLPNALAHCDGLDGPVVQGAQKALDTGDVNLVLIWVSKNDEAEIRKTFKEALAVRKINAEARRLADAHFFETLVRLHRAGEGAGFTGLKPAGRDLGPAIPTADKALRDGNAEPLMKLLTATIQDRVHDHFNEAFTKQKFASDDLAAGRAFVKAYVEYIHCVEALYETATHPTHGHYDDTEKVSSQKEHHDSETGSTKREINNENIQ